MIVYRATNLVNWKVYVGATVQPFECRLAQHKYAAARRGRTPLYSAIRKYGNEAFRWEVVRECATIDELRRAEHEEIAKHNSVAGEGWGYNRTRGGDGILGFKFSEESIAKRRASRAGWTMPLEQRVRQSLARRGKPMPSREGVKHTPEAIAKIKANHVGRKGKTNAPAMNASLLAGRLAVSKLRPSMVADVWQRRAEGHSFARIASDYGVTPSAVFYFCKRSQEASLGS